VILEIDLAFLLCLCSSVFGASSILLCYYRNVLAKDCIGSAAMWLSLMLCHLCLSVAKMVSLIKGDLIPQRALSDNRLTFDVGWPYDFHETVVSLTPHV
jgi:hypothetical protein